MATSHRRSRGNRVDSGAEVLDDLVVEEPLEMRIGDGRTTLRSIITMRTPGSDAELAVGWLRGEGVVRESGDVVAARACTDRSLPEVARGNVINVDLAASALPRIASLGRTSDVTSACGVCGADSLDRVLTSVCDSLGPASPVIDASTVLDLPTRLLDAQRVFARTGGLHGAALADADGSILVVREDIGRHNAVDKALGWALMHDVAPTALVVSSRASFEIVQKAAAGRVPVVVAVSAPSTLAVDLADSVGLTLVAFARDGRATAYTHRDRLR